MMWWLLRADVDTLSKRWSTPASSLSNLATSTSSDQAASKYNYLQLSAYPEPPLTWVKVDAANHDNQENKTGDNSCKSGSSGLKLKKKKKSKTNNFLLREVKKPEKKALRYIPLLKHPILLGEPKKKKLIASYINVCHQARSAAVSDVPTLLSDEALSMGKDWSFPVPLSWRSPDGNLLIPDADRSKRKNGDIITIKLPVKDVSSSKDQGLSLSQKLAILYEQEGLTPLMPRYAIPKSLNSERQPTEAEKRLCNWIALEVKPLIGRLEGSQRSASSIGKRLNSKSRRLCLWHEEFSQSGGRSARAILLHSLVSSSRLDSSEKKLLSSGENETPIGKPMCHLMRVTLPYNFRASPRIDPEEQQKEMEKGGHGSARDKLADYNMLVESLRRQKDARLDKEEARMLLCKGVLHDNMQEYQKAIESYTEFLILCIKNGDKQGEATAYNFIGCSLQEGLDLKLAEYHSKSKHDLTGIHSAAAIQYEEVEEYHKLHAETADLDGKFMAHTNLGLLYANLGRWSDSTAAHQVIYELYIC